MIFRLSFAFPPPHPIRNHPTELKPVSLVQEDVDRVMQSRDRSKCPPSAVPYGLYLLEVFYPPEVLEPEPDEVLEVDMAKF